MIAALSCLAILIVWRLYERRLRRLQDYTRQLETQIIQLRNRMNRLEGGRYL